MFNLMDLCGAFLAGAFLFGIAGFFVGGRHEQAAMAKVNDVKNHITTEVNRGIEAGKAKAEQVINKV